MLRLFHASALALALWQFATADPVSEPPFPNIPVPVHPEPTPKVDPDAVPVLSEGVFYVVKSDAPFLLYASPPGLVTISKEAGPIRLRGVFIDGTGKVQTRTFNQKCLAFVEVVPGAKGRVELIYQLEGAKDESKAIRRMVDVNTAPQPPPDPPIPPGPKPPTPGDSPFNVPGLRVLMLTETGQPITSQQLSTLFGKDTATLLDAKCKEWRVFDKDAALPEPWKTAADKARANPNFKTPWLLIGNGKAGESIPLPADLKALVTKYAE